MMQFFPWQAVEWQKLLASKTEGRLAHAYLLEGLPGLGKLEFAKAFAKLLLCESPNELAACEQCRSCQLVTAGSHPDYQLLLPEATGKAIKIDSIRQLNEVITTTPQIASRQVVVLSPAEAMNRAAANALLKSLEEPPGETFFFLVSSAANKLLPTIRSRCQWLHFSSPSKQQAEEWLLTQVNDMNQASLALQLSGGAPLLALSLLESDELIKRKQWFASWLAWQQGQLAFSQLVAEWKDEPLDRLLMQLASWLADVVRLLVAGDIARLSNSDFGVELNAMASGLSEQRVTAAYELVTKKIALITGPISVNEQLQLEEVLVQWLSVVSRRSR